jgi:hypothetical protein
MPTVSVIRAGETLRACNRHSAVLLSHLPEHVPLVGELRQRRNGRFHRLIFSIFGHVAEALNAGPLGGTWTADDVLTNVKLATGRAVARPASARERTLYAMPAGSMVLIPASVSFAAMDETAFSGFAREALDYIAGDLCPYLRAAPQWGEIVELLRHAGVEP